MKSLFSFFTGKTSRIVCVLLITFWLSSLLHISPSTYLMSNASTYIYSPDLAENDEFLWEITTETSQNFTFFGFRLQASSIINVTLTSLPPLRQRLQLSPFPSWYSVSIDDSLLDRNNTDFTALEESNTTTNFTLLEAYLLGFIVPIYVTYFNHDRLHFLADSQDTEYRGNYIDVERYFNISSYLTKSSWITDFGVLDSFSLFINSSSDVSEKPAISINLIQNPLKEPTFLFLNNLQWILVISLIIPLSVLFFIRFYVFRLRSN